MKIPELEWERFNTGIYKSTTSWVNSYTGASYSLYRISLGGGSYQYYLRADKGSILHNTDNYKEIIEHLERVLITP